MSAANAKSVFALTFISIYIVKLIVLQRNSYARIAEKSLSPKMVLITIRKFTVGKKLLSVTSVVNFFGNGLIFKPILRLTREKKTFNVKLATNNSESKIVSKDMK